MFEKLDSKSKEYFKKILKVGTVVELTSDIDYGGGFEGYVVKAGSRGVVVWNNSDILVDFGGYFKINIMPIYKNYETFNIVYSP